MHYLANGKYWWDVASGREQPPQFTRAEPIDLFMGTIVFGAVEGDELPPMDTPTEEVSEWLRERLLALRRAFREDMKRAYELRV